MAKKALLQISSSLLHAAGTFKGKNRIMRHLSQFLTLQTQPMVVEREGVFFAVDGADLIEQHVLFSGGYGKSVNEGLKRLKPQHDDFVFWDIGANIGTVTLPFAKANPKATIYSFEPSPAVLTKLSHNISLNPTLQPSIRCFNLALSNITGPTPFYPSNELGNSGIGGLYADDNREKNPIFIHSTSATHLIDEGICRKPDLIKIDVEGWELEVLQGFGDYLTSDDAPQILFEHSPYRFVTRGLAKSVVIDLLQSLEYQLTILHSDGSTEPYLDHMKDQHCDIIASKMPIPE